MASINFLKTTRFFLVVGLFIPGFSAICLLGLQIALTKIGFECVAAFKAAWIFSAITVILLPIIFYKIILKNKRWYARMGIWLTLFNLLEYSFLQAFLAIFFSDPNTLCYVSDGQNGMELVFTAWLGLPILYVLSLLFYKTWKAKIAAN